MLRSSVNWGVWAGGVPPPPPRQHIVENPDSRVRDQGMMIVGGDFYMNIHVKNR